MRILVIGSLLVLALAGCSKKRTAATDTPQDAALTNADQAATEPGAEAAPAEPAPAPEPPPPDNPQIAQDLNGTENELQQQNYDAAVDNLAAMRVAQAQMNEAQRRAYQEQMYRTMEYLRQKAETDAAAKAAYQKLGRAAMGR